MKIRYALICIGLTMPLLHGGGERTGSLVQQAPERVFTTANPLADREQARRAGAKLFDRECASCHGPQGSGGLGKAPPLAQPEVQDAPPGALFWVLRNGSLRSGMPSFAHLPEAQRWQIVMYLKGLGER